MKKILFVATITDHFYYFHIPYLKFFHDSGWKVYVAGKGDRKLPFCDVQFDIPFVRSPFSKGNINAYKGLKKVIDENDFDIIHCHTPMGGILTRIAADKKRKNGAKVLYTAHGFHFYKGAPFLNWAIYYPIERLMSHKTDCLITINEEDYAFAKRHFSHTDVRRVDGVGYNSDLYFPVSGEEKLKLRVGAGYKKEEKILIYVAELNANKNQQMLIKMMTRLRTPGVRLLLVGADNFDGKYQTLAKENGVADKIEFLGHREDIPDLLRMSDLCVASSLREGLPVNIMEAMATGLPVIAGDNRGHRALIINNNNGFTVLPDDFTGAAEIADKLLTDDKLYEQISSKAAQSIRRFSKEEVSEQMKSIYSDLMR